MLCFDLQPRIFGYLDGLIMILLGMCNFYLLYRYPLFEEYQRRKHYHVRDIVATAPQLSTNASHKYSINTFFNDDVLLRAHIRVLMR
jgi:hypothetical protein